jgi:hypothetical protein
MFNILLDSELNQLDTFPECSHCGCFISGGWVAKNLETKRLYHWDTCIAPWLVNEDIESTVIHYSKRLERERARKAVSA